MSSKMRNLEWETPMQPFLPPRRRNPQFFLRLCLFLASSSLSYLFWTSNEANQSKVCRSYLDGSNQTTVLSDGLMEPKSLAVNDNKLYVCDGNRIICSDLDGSNQETIFDGGEGYEVSKIAVDEQFVYWIDKSVLISLLFLFSFFLVLSFTIMTCFLIRLVDLRVAMSTI